MERAALPKTLDLANLKSKLDQVDKLMLASLRRGPLKTTAAELLSRGGKRLRPALLMATAALGANSNEAEVLSAAAAVELIHQASLAHDAITDEQLPDRDLNLALLTGDSLIAAGLGLAASVEPWVAGELAVTVQTMAKGQAKQQTGRYLADPTDDFYLATITDKTASLFRSAVRIGGRLGGLKAEPFKAISQYGEAFGVAFQITDDITDEEFDPKWLPKAKQIARQHFELAVDSLDDFPSSHQRAGLENLVGWYVNHHLS